MARSKNKRIVKRQRWNQKRKRRLKRKKAAAKQAG